jgi:hypothetical protein
MGASATPHAAAQIPAEGPQVVEETIARYWEA